MTRYLIFLFFFSGAFTAKAQGIITLQDKPFVFSVSTDSSIWKSLNNDNLFSSLSIQEKQAYYWVNLFRKSPEKFYSTVIKAFVQQFPEAKTSEWESLGQDIKNKESLPFLFPEKGLLSMSRKHSEDLWSRNGVISHKSSEGKGFSQRISETGSYRCGAENIYVGSHDPLEAIITLLIDYGVVDKGHRKNLLNPTFQQMGLSFIKRGSQKAVLVQVLACL